MTGKIGVAVSGGIDSMTLLCMLLRAGVKPYVINVEHGIRGARSKHDSEFVKAICDENDLEYFFTEVDAPKVAERDGISLELAARNLRYEFFQELLEKKMVDVIALAHHADDNAETLLMRIFRGTGIRGLKGITERDGFIRPLLKYTRDDIEKYARENKVPYVIDETNSDTAFTRNFIRNELMPLIKSRYPDVAASFTRLSESAAEADEFLSSLALRAEPTHNGKILKNVYLKPLIVQKYSINAALNEMGATKDIEYRHLVSLLALKNKENNSSIDLPFGITAVKQNSDLYFYYRDKETFTEREFSESETFTYRGYSYRFERAKEMTKGISADLNKLKHCLIRSRRDGDYFHRVNGKNKLLSDFLNEKKLTKTEKDALLVLAEGSTVYAILGLEVAEQAKIDNDATTIINIIKEKREIC